MLSKDPAHGPRADQPPAGDEEPVRLLIVEDDEDDFLITCDRLDGQDRMVVKVTWAASDDDALAAILEQRHDAYLIDHRLGERTGLELTREAFAARPAARVRARHP